MLFMPVIDDLLKKEAFNQIVINGKGQTKDSTTFLQALTPQKNVEKAIHFIKSKFGVGVVALDITGHSVFGSENINLAPVYSNPSNQFKPASTSLLFEGLENNYSLTSMYDANNRIISEVQSQTMNSQVDAGKDPYAVLLGINNQTLGIMMYLVRRGVPVVTVLKFLSQPLIQDYLVEQRKNESIINKQRGNEVGKAELVENLYGKHNLRKPKLNRQYLFDDAKLDKGIRRNVMDNDQAHYFEYFLTLIDETGAFNDLKNGITVDTKGKKDKSAVENFEALWDRINKTEIVSANDIGKLRNNSVLAPFFDAQELYRKLYFPFYALDSSAFGNKLKAMKDMVSNRQKGTYKKDKVRNVIDNDFLTFLIQNSHPDFNEDVFNQLFGFTNEKSLAQEVKELLNNEVYARNPVLKAFHPLLSIDKDAVHTKLFDVMRLFERELSTIDLNDFIDAMKDIRDEISEDLYKSIIQLGLYQAGFNNSPFSLNKVFPTFKSSTRTNGKLVDFQNDYLREIQIATLKAIPQFELNADMMFDQFEELFYRNNTEFLPKKYSKYSPIKYFFTYSAKDDKRHLFYKADENTGSVFMPVLGGTYFKRYFASNAIGIESPKVAEPIDNDEEYTPFEEVKDEHKGRVTKVISGGQTGVDRLGLEVASELDIPTGGTATPGFVTESGKDLSLRDKFGVQEIHPDIQRGRSGKEFYLPRTEENVKNSDGTVYFATDEDSAGRIATERFAKQNKKPFIINPDVLQLVKWMSENNIKTLNVAGNRGSKVSKEQLERYRQVLTTALYSGYNVQPQQLSLFDDTFTVDEAQEAEELKKECKGSKTTIVK
jgi:hypothetical protein